MTAYDIQKDIDAEGQRAAVFHAGRAEPAAGVTEMLRAQKIEIDQPYTEGVMGDGAAILKDGALMTVSQILHELNEYAWIRHCAQLAGRRK